MNPFHIIIWRKLQFRNTSRSLRMLVKICAYIRFVHYLGFSLLCVAERERRRRGESYRFRLSISECHVLSVRFLSVWHEMAPVIGCRRRPILGSGRTSYKFREMDGLRGGFGPEHSSIFQARRRRERRWKWTVHFSARWRCALRPTNHPLLTLNYTRPRISKTTPDYLLFSSARRPFTATARKMHRDRIKTSSNPNRTNCIPQVLIRITLFQKAKVSHYSYSCFYSHSHK